MRWIAIATVLFIAAPAQATPPETKTSLADAAEIHPQPTEPVAEATALLSRYAPGLVPVEPAVIYAIGVLADHGTRTEISLLRNLAENERAEIRDAAITAISRMREIQVNEQRESFAKKLPNWPDLNATANSLRKKAGYGREEARCVAYAGMVLGDEPAVEPAPADGDPWELLSMGHPRKAIAAARSLQTSEARLAEARGREEIGDLRGALQDYAYLASSGDPDARRSIDRFGVDAERLLLGVLATPEALYRDKAEITDVLVRSGGDLTVSVFAERSRGSDSKGEQAVIALGRMLDEYVREDPLPASSRRTARRALVLASRDGGRLSEVAREALKSIP